MNNVRIGRWGLPPVVQNLLIANVVLWLVVWMATRTQATGTLAVILNNMMLFPAESPFFRVWQPVTYMFMHAGWMHVLFNMFTLWMFGRFIEMDLGSRRFFVYYMVCGVGAAIVQLLVGWLTGSELTVPTVGASGAIYGLLLAFGMLHPNDIIVPLIPPIPMKAKWAVLVFAGIELFMGIGDTVWNFSDNVAHFAHLGGALFGFVLLWWWLRTKKIYRYS